MKRTKPYFFDVPKLPKKKKPRPKAAPGYRICYGCKKELPLNRDFFRRPHKNLYQCRKCENIQLAQRRKRQKFNCGPAKYQRMCEEQNYVCLLCKLPADDTHGLLVDYDRKFRKVRGLTCSRCHFISVLLSDDLDLAKVMVEYAKQFLIDPKEPDPVEDEIIPLSECGSSPLPE